MSEQPPVDHGDEPTQTGGASGPGTAQFPPVGQGGWVPGWVPAGGPAGPVPPGAQWWGPPPPGFYGSPPPRPPRPPRPHPLLTLAAGIAAAAMIALGVGIGYIVWGSPTAAVRSRSSLPVTPRVPSSGATTNHGFLGVVIAPSAPAASGTSGAQVLKVVPGDPAAKAGIVAGDTITSFGTRKVVSSITLEFDTRQDPPGTKVSVGWSTSTGKHEHATVTLAKAPKSTSLG